ncbi:MAG: membrane protein insertase YidC [Phycisphaeraceae bacterium]|nr:membrane protein insertase YidC [Phycisphaeraceae bacterium]
MTPAVRRAVITTLVLFVVAGIFAVAIKGGGSRAKTPNADAAGADNGALVDRGAAGTDRSIASPSPTTTAPSAPLDSAASGSPATPALADSAAPDQDRAVASDATAGDTLASGAQAAPVTDAASPSQSDAPSAAVTPPSTQGESTSPPVTPRARPRARPDGYSAIYEARVPGGAEAPDEADLVPLGSLDPAQARFRVRFHPRGAGVSEVVFSQFWKNVSERIAFEAHERAVRAGRPPPPLPPDSERYVLQTLQRFGSTTIPLLAAIDVNVDGEQVKLLDDVWGQVSPGVFATEIVDLDDGTLVARIERRFEVTGAVDGFGAGYNLRLLHRIENHTGAEVPVRLSQCGPGDLTLETALFMDTRRFQFGYLYSPQRDPSRQAVIVHGATEERSEVLSRIDAGNNLLWPTPAQREAGYEISWYGTTNRYFALAVHAPLEPPQQTSKSLAHAVEQVLVTASPGEPASRVIFSTLRAPEMRVPARSAVNLELGVYAGPLDPRVLDRVEPFAALNLSGLILYQMSGCCAWCTFAWLAKGIVSLLIFLHDHVVFDWGLAIIVLVAMVRLMLHPLTRASQINMQRFARGMQELKPQLDAIQKRYADDPERLKAEQFRLYRERGVNPVGCLGGILPTFLQTPIWIALYAVLFFAFALRQEPAFFGVFQLFGGWMFLADLSAPDHFISFGRSLNFWLFSLDGINILPILMGVVFWFSQKYMSPPPTTKLTPEQESQQKMMKWMMVLIFPIFMFKMPSGLTLYILTSTIVGLFESRAVRKQIERMDLSPKQPAKKKKQDLMGRMYSDALERAREKQKGPPKKYKER